MNAPPEGRDRFPCGNVTTQVPAPPSRYGPRVASDDEELLELDGREVRLTSPGKVLFAERGETKRDLVDYYLRVASRCCGRWAAGRC